MTDYTQALEKHIVVVNQLDTKTTFAVEPETGEQVFVSARLARMFNIVPGDHLRAFVTPNKVPENTVQWYAIYVTPEAPPENPFAMLAHMTEEVEEVEEVEEAQQLEMDLEAKRETSRTKYQDAILRHLKDGIDTAKNIAKEVGSDTTTVTCALISLHKDGLVARAGVKAKPDQLKDSHVLWALKASDFLPQPS